MRHFLFLTLFYACTSFSVQGQKEKENDQECTQVVEVYYPYPGAAPEYYTREVKNFQKITSSNTAGVVTIAGGVYLRLSSEKE